MPAFLFWVLLALKFNFVLIRLALLKLPSNKLVFGLMCLEDITVFWTFLRKGFNYLLIEAITSFGLLEIYWLYN